MTYLLAILAGAIQGLTEFLPISSTGHLIIFEKKLLNDAIGRSLVPSLGAEEHVTVQNLEDLAFTFKDKETTNPSNSTNLSFFLRGTPRVVWVFDEETLRGDLVGKPKSELKTLLSGFPSINKAEVVLRPVWKRTFPKDVKNIKVELIINE